MTVTDEYKKYSDIFAKYFDKYTCKSDTYTHLIDLYEDFEEWFYELYSNKKIPSRKEILNGIKKHIKIDGKVSTGIENIKLIKSDITNRMDLL